MTIPISMWSGPRNISTTMMRSFGSRSDTQAIDEPFYGQYLARTGADHPFRTETIAAYPTDVEGVLRWIGEPREKPLLFLKHIAYHLPVDVDLSFLATHRNFLLIRDPRAMVASFADKYDDVAPVTRSYEIAGAIHDFLDRRGLACPVVDAADILAAPEAMMRRLCAALDIAFDPAMLSWEAGPRPEDGPWAPHWYDAVWKSTGFRPPVEKSVSLAPALEAAAAAAANAYARLREIRLRA